jgi:5-methyltetrahydrofolate--homocysteine methyltransferase
MGPLLEKLKHTAVLVADGAWGTMLQAKGLAPGDCAEEWNISHPEVVRCVPAAYAEAGADMVLTNTFGGSRSMLARKGYGDRVQAFNTAAASISLQAAPGCLVAGSVGPTGEFLAPLGQATEAELEQVFEEQIEAIVQAGVRVICVETMTAIEEAICAVRAARRVIQTLEQAVDILATVTFDPTPHGFRTMMGVSIEQAIAGLTEAGADVLGSNCGNGIEQMVPITAEFAELTDKPILIQANAGMPVMENGQPVYRQTPEVMQSRVADLMQAGARIIGGCCGTTPAHIAAIRKVVDTLP